MPAADQTSRRFFPPNHTFDDPFQYSHALEQEEAEGNDDDVGADGDDEDATESKMDQGGEDKGRGGTSQQVPSEFHLLNPFFQIESDV